MTTSTLSRFRTATQYALTHKHSGYGCGRPVMQTGYYGRIDEQGRTRTSKTHVRFVGEDGPLCKANLHPDMAFHWCANRAEMTFVECDSCKQYLAKAIRAEDDVALMSCLTFHTTNGRERSARDLLIMDRGHALRMGDTSSAQRMTLELLNGR
jgi:hypothetical protein